MPVRALMLFLFPLALLRGEDLPVAVRDQLAASVERVYELVRDHHWDPKAVGPKWAAARDRTLHAVRHASTRREAQSAMETMLGTLGQSHFHIVPAAAYNLREEASEAASGETAGAAEAEAPRATASPTAPVPRGEPWDLGFELDYVEGRAVVLDPGSAFDHGVRRGWELIELNGRPMAPVLETIADESAGDREGFGKSVLTNLLMGPRTRPAAVRFRDGAGAEVALTLPRVQPKGRRARFGHLPAARVFLDSSRTPSGALVLRLNLFMDPERVMPAMQKAVATCGAACPGIVLDLRGNPGGLGAMAMGVAGFFVKKFEQRLGTQITRDGRVEFEIRPRASTYDGPLAILIDGGSASTSEILAQGLRDLKRARLFGSATAGAALPSQFERLPSGDGIQYAVATYVSKSGKRIEGRGVRPDVVAPHTLAALRAGNDSALDAALAWIGKQGKK